MFLSKNPVKHRSNYRKWVAIPILSLFMGIQGNALQADVNATGAFEYNIPLEIPDGVNGITPNLSLDYNSNGKNGIVGNGWSLTGLPTITRINHGKGIQFNGGDTYTAPEGRLVDINGDKSEYHTVRQEWTKYVPQGTCGDGPCSWTATDKDGNTLHYGTTEDSRIEAIGKNGSVRVWALQKLEDTYGNNYTITYQEDANGGNYYPEQIEYSNYAVRFGYGAAPGVNQQPISRTDRFTKFDTGSKVETNRLLTYIQVFANNNLLGGYHAEYKKSEQGHSILKSISRQANDGDSYKLYDFGWSEEKTEFLPKSRWYHSAKNERNQPRWKSGESTLSDLIDMNGDGLLDRVEHHEYSEYNVTKHGLWISLNNGKGFDEKKRWFSSPNKDANYPKRGASGHIYNDLIDMNGDGLPDRIAQYNYKVKQYGLWVALNNGTGFDEQTRWFHSTHDAANIPKWYAEGQYRTNLIDINGDGLPDRVAWYDYEKNQYGLWVSINTGSGFKAKKRWFYSVRNEANYPKWKSSTGTTYSDLIDMNGDGMLDRVEHYDYDGAKQFGLWVSINNGDGFNPKTRWFFSTQGEACYPEWYNGSIVSGLIDLNGDGLPDKVEHRDYDGTNEDGIWVSINTGTGFEAKKRWFFTKKNEQNYVQRNHKGSILAKFMDMNGDGLPDRVEHYDYETAQYGLWVSINTGTSFAPKTRWFYSTTNEANYPNWNHETNGSSASTLLDINGDGLPDRLERYDYDKTKEYGLWVSINTGAGFEKKKKWWFSPTINATYPSWISSPSGNIYRDLKDMNGDGLLDRIEDYDHNTDQHGLFVSLNNSASPKLNFIRNSKGGETTITYKRSQVNRTESAATANVCTSKPETPYRSECGIPETKQLLVVATILTGDGRAETGWNENGKNYDLKKTFQFFNPRTYRGDYPGMIGSLTTGKPLGFAKKLESTLIKSGGEWVTLTTEVTEFRQEALFDHDNKPETAMIDSPFSGYPVRITTYQGSERGTKIEELKIEYNDNKDNLHKLYPFGPEMKVYQPLARKQTTTVFEAENPVITKTKEDLYDTYGYPVKNIECSATGSFVTDQDCTVSEFAYLRDSIWDLGRLSESKKSVLGNILTWEKLIYQGNQVITRQALHCDDAENCGEATGTWADVSKNMGYNANGQLIYSENALGASSKTVYDETFPALVKANINAKGQRADYRYNNLGQLIVQIDPNGQYSRFFHDNFGRKSRTENALGAWAKQDFHFWGDPEKQYVEVTFLEGAGVSWKRDYYDGAGFNYKTESQGDNGRLIVTESQSSYEGDQKVIATSNPYFQGDPVRWNRKWYDSRERLQRYRSAKGLTITYEYGPNRQIKKTEKGDTTSYYNAEGQLIRKVDPLGGEVSYQYDTAQRLIKTVIPKASEITITYNNRGLRTSLSDPSMGTTTYGYDLVGNQTSRTDALNRTATFAYDSLNRMIKKSTASGSITTWQYDDSKVYNAVGRLTKVEYAHGSNEVLEYDPLGNVKKSRTRLNGLPVNQDRIIRYDNRNRPVFIMTHDGVVQEYEYSIAGNLKEVRMGGLVYGTYSNYNAAGKVGQLITNNNEPYKLTTAYEYDEDEILTSLLTTDRAGKEIQHNSYHFDLFGNLLSIQDERDPVNTLIQSTNTDVSQAFTYDELHRLTKAIGSYGVKNYKYDEIGNPTQVGAGVNRTMRYEGQQVISGDNFLATYDAVGNMVTKTVDGVQWEYAYNDEGRLIQIKKGNLKIEDFFYDSTGKRIKKIFHREDGSTVTTWYVGNDLEYWQDSRLAFHKKTRHVHGVGTQKLASVTIEIPGDASTAMDAVAALSGFNGPFFSDGLSSGSGSSMFQSLSGTQTLWFGFMIASFAFVSFQLVRIRQTGKESSFRPFQRVVALYMIPVFMMTTSCSPDSGSGDSANKNNPGETIQVEEPGGITSSGLVRKNRIDELPYYGSLNEILTTLRQQGFAEPEEKAASYSGNMKEGYTPFPIGGPLPGTWFYHPDHLGTASIITDAHGEEATRMLYLPFGEIDREHSTGTDSVSHKFTGQERDEENGLLYYGARYYDPTIGRFLTADPLIPEETNLQSFNRYTYTYNNPVVYTDPTGHRSLKKIGKIGGKIGSGIEDLKRKAEQEGKRAEEKVKETLSSAVKPVKEANQQVKNELDDLAKRTENEIKGNLDTLIPVGAYVAGTTCGFVCVGVYNAVLAKVNGMSDRNILLTAIVTGGGYYFSNHEALSSFSPVANFFGSTLVDGVVAGATAELSGGQFETGFKDEVLPETKTFDYKWTLSKLPKLYSTFTGQQNQASTLSNINAEKTKAYTSRAYHWGRVPGRSFLSDTTFGQL